MVIKKSYLGVKHCEHCHKVVWEDKVIELLPSTQCHLTDKVKLVIGPEIIRIVVEIDGAGNEFEIKKSELKKWL